MCVFKKTYFQLKKIINKDSGNENDGSGSNNDDDVKDYGDNHGIATVIIMKSMMMKMIMMMIIVITMAR